MSSGHVSVVLRVRPPPIQTTRMQSDSNAIVPAAGITLTSSARCERVAAAAAAEVTEGGEGDGCTGRQPERGEPGMLLCCEALCGEGPSMRDDLRVKEPENIQGPECVASWCVVVVVVITVMPGPTAAALELTWRTPVMGPMPRPPMPLMLPERLRVDSGAVIGEGGWLSENEPPAAWDKGCCMDSCADETEVLRPLRGVGRPRWEEGEGEWS